MPIGSSDANLNFSAELDDQTSPKLDALKKKLEEMGANPTQIKMIISAVDQATPAIQQAQASAAQMPSTHTLHIHAATDEFEKKMSELKEHHSSALHIPVSLEADSSQVEQHIRMLRQQYAAPLAGMAPGGSSGIGGLGVGALAGAGVGATALGGVALLTATLKESINANNNLQQQMTQLTVAVKDTGTAQQQMNALTGMSNNSIFSRSDLTQADIIAQQFHLPAFAGQSPYMPQGVLNVASNAAAANPNIGGGVTAAAEAIARASEGYYRSLIPYGVSINQQDFQTGGRFAGKSPLQAVNQVLSTYQGAVQQQERTFTGMMDNFKNQWENKVIEPLGKFAFSGLQGVVSAAGGAVSGSSGTSKVNSLVGDFQTGLTKVWELVQKGAQYFATNLEKPLEQIVANVVKIGATFGQVFAGVGLNVLTTFASALTIVVKTLSSIASSGPAKPLIEMYAVMKSLQVLGLGNVVKPLQNLFSLNPLRFIQGLAGLPAMLAKIAAFEIGKGFIDAIQASNDMKNSFKGIGDNLDMVNAKLDVTANKLGISATVLKQMTANAGNILINDPNSSMNRLNLSAQIASNAQRLHNNIGGVSATTASQLIAEAVAKSGNYTSSSVTKFTDELAQATAAAKSLGGSFSDLVTTMTQYKASANASGLGGIQGSGALEAMKIGATNLQKRGLLSTNPATGTTTASDLLTQVMSNYTNIPANEMQNVLHPSAAIQRLLGVTGLSSVYNFQSNPGATSKFLGQGQQFLGQVQTSNQSIDQYRKYLQQNAPSALSGQYAVQMPTNVLQSSAPNLQALTSGTAVQQAQAAAQAVSQLSKNATDAANEVQKLDVQLQTYANQTDQLTAAQDSLNLKMQQFTQDTLVPLQRQLDAMQLSLSNLEVNSITPLQNAMNSLNQQQATVSNTQQNAQWYMDKYTEGLTNGQQAAEDQTQALTEMNNQIQLMMTSYQQIGAQLGQTNFASGVTTRVAPLAGISLADQEQEIQKKQQINSLQYQIKYGQQQYEMQKAARPIFESETIPYDTRLKQIKDLVPQLNTAASQTHKMANEQYNLQTQMYNANKEVIAQTTAIQKLQNVLTGKQDSPQMYSWQNQQYQIQQALDLIDQKTNVTQALQGAISNSITPIQTEMQNVMNLFNSLKDLSGPNAYKTGQNMLKVAVETHIISPGVEKYMSQLLGKGETAAKDQPLSFNNGPGWMHIGAWLIAGMFSGATEREIGTLTNAGIHNLVNAVPGGKTHIPIIGGTIASKAGDVGEAIAGLAATVGALYVGQAAIRIGLGATRLGVAKLGEHVIRHILPDRMTNTHVLGTGQKIWRDHLQNKMDKVELHLASLDPNDPAYVSAQNKAASLAKSLDKYGDKMTKSDFDQIIAHYEGNLETVVKNALHPISHVEQRLAGNAGEVVGSTVATALTGSRLVGNFAGARVGGYLEGQMEQTTMADLVSGIFDKLTKAGASVKDASAASAKFAADVQSQLDKAKISAVNISDDFKTATKNVTNLPGTSTKSLKTFSDDLKTPSSDIKIGGADLSQAVRDVTPKFDQFKKAVSGDFSTAIKDMGDTVNNSGGFIHDLGDHVAQFGGDHGVGGFLKAVVAFGAAGAALLAGLPTTLEKAISGIFGSGSHHLPTAGHTTSTEDAAKTASRSVTEAHMAAIKKVTADAIPHTTSTAKGRVTIGSHDTHSSGIVGDLTPNAETKSVLTKIFGPVNHGSNLWQLEQLATGTTGYGTAINAAAAATGAANLGRHVIPKVLGKGAEDAAATAAEKLGASTIAKAVLEGAGHVAGPASWVLTGVQVGQAVGKAVSAPTESASQEVSDPALQALRKIYGGVKSVIGTSSTGPANTAEQLLGKQMGLVPSMTNPQTQKLLEEIAALGTSKISTTNQQQAIGQLLPNVSGLSGSTSQTRSLITWAQQQVAGLGPDAMKEQQQMAQDLQKTQTYLTAKGNAYGQTNQGIEQAQTNHWTIMAALNAVQQKNDETNLGQYLVKEKGDHLTTNQNIEQYAQTHYGNMNSITNQGYTQISDTSSKWLKKIENDINHSLKIMGVATPAPTSTNKAPAPSGVTGADVQKAGFAHGGIPREHLIRGKGDSKGYLAHVGEEGDEMIIPLSPHRRERAKSLISQAAGLVGGMKHAHHPHLANGGIVNPLAGVPHNIHATADILPGLASGGVVNSNKLSALEQVASVISNKHFPYLWGGGHSPATFGGPYDCSGAVSALLRDTGYLPAGVSDVAVAFESMFLPGPGAATIWANPSHTYMDIAGKGWGTSLSNPGGGAGWFTGGGRPGFVARHLPGLDNTISPTMLATYVKEAAGGGSGEGIPSLTLPKVPSDLKKMGPAGVAVSKMLTQVSSTIRAQMSSIKGSGGGGGFSGTVISTGGRNQKAWATDLLRTLGLPVSASNLQAIVGWELAEGGNWNNDARFNPLNTTMPEPGAGNTGAQGNIKVYQSWDQGLAATAATLRNGAYGAILSALQSGKNADAVAAAIGASPWGTNAGSVESIIAGLGPSNYAAGGFIPKYAGGAKITQPQQLAILHQGEQVLNAGEANLHAAKQQGTSTPHEVGTVSKMQLNVLKEILDIEKSGDPISKSLQKSLNDQSTTLYKELHLSRQHLESLDAKAVQQKAGNDLAALNAALRREVGGTKGAGPLKGTGGSELEASAISAMSQSLLTAIHTDTAAAQVENSALYKQAVLQAQIAAAELPGFKAAMTEVEEKAGVAPAVQKAAMQAATAIGKNEAVIAAFHNDAHIFFGGLTAAQAAADSKKISHLQAIDVNLAKEHTKSAEKELKINEAQIAKLEKAMKKGLTPAQDKEIAHLEKIDDKLGKIAAAPEKHMTKTQKKDYSKDLAKVETAVKQINIPKQMLAAANKTPAIQNQAAVNAIKQWVAQEKKAGASSSLIAKAITATMQSEGKSQSQINKTLAKVDKDGMTADKANQAGHKSTQGAVSKAQQAANKAAEANVKAREGGDNGRVKTREGGDNNRAKAKAAMDKVSQSKLDDIKGASNDGFSKWNSLSSNQHDDLKAHMTSEGDSSRSHIDNVNDASKHTTGATSASDKNRTKAESNVESRAAKQHTEMLNKLDELKSSMQVSIVNNATGASLSSTVTPANLRSR